MHARIDRDQGAGRQEFQTSAMSRELRRRGIAWASAGALALATACAPQPQPIAELDRGALEPVGLVMARFQPVVRIDDLNYGGAEGFASGAVRGAGEGLGAGLSMNMGSCSGSVCGAAVILYLGIVAVAGIAGAVVGGVEGAEKAVPAEAGRKAEAAARTALTEGMTQEPLRDAVIEAAENLAQVQLVPLAELGPASHEDTPSYASAASRGVHSVLEVALLEMGLAGAETDDQRVGFYMLARARVIRLDSGREVYSHELANLGARRSIQEWAQFDSARIQEETRRGYRRLAETIVEEVFLLWRSGDPVEPTRNKLAVAR